MNKSSGVNHSIYNAELCNINVNGHADEKALAIYNRRTQKSKAAF